jgi:poly(hydroxyalkanoate) depolymerase family esterase
MRTKRLTKMVHRAARNWGNRWLLRGVKKLKRLKTPMWHLFGFEPNATDSHATPLPEHGARSGRRQAAGRFLSAVYRNEAGSRRYKLYVPSGYAGQALPLLVMLHGCKQEPDDFAAGTRMNAVGESFQCLVAYPAQSRSGNGMRCWNWFDPQHQRRERGEPALIAGIVRAIMAGYAVNANAVYVAGMSAGGAMALVLANTYPELFRAVGVHSALPYASAHDTASALEAMKRGAPLGRVGSNACRIPVIAFHGDTDAVVHPSNAEGIIAQWLAAHGQTALQRRVDQGIRDGGRRYRVTRYMDAGGRVAAEFWLVHGAGHAWSGGSRRGSHTDPKGPDASARMMEFFRARTQGGL